MPSFFDHNDPNHAHDDVHRDTPESDDNDAHNDVDPSQNKETTPVFSSKL